MERGGTAVRRVPVGAAGITADNEKTLYPYYSGLSRLVHLLYPVISARHCGQL